WWFSYRYAPVFLSYGGRYLLGLRNDLGYPGAGRHVLPDGEGADIEPLFKALPALASLLQTRFLFLIQDHLTRSKVVQGLLVMLKTMKTLKTCWFTRKYHSEDTAVGSTASITSINKTWDVLSIPFPRNPNYIQMRVVVTGASGLLGRAVVTEFRNAGHEVTGVAFSRAKGDLKKLNLEDSPSVEAFIDQEKPDVVVHCAAERRPDVVENDPNGAKDLNVQVPGLLADLTNDRGILLIYISTDYVFDGTSPPYDVRDKANPLNTYGQTKYDGELEVKKLNSSAIILRVPILYGITEYNGESAVNALIDSVKDGKVTTMDHYAIRYPTNVADVARVIKDLSVKVRDEKVFISGILHFSGEEKYTKYEICEVIAKALNVPLDHLKPVDTAPKDGTTRPYDCHLSNRCLNGIGINTQCVKFSEWMQWWLSKDRN
ncbi:hypothetical protein BGZ46_002202, partial [Entomortierella lignicola]